MDDQDVSARICGADGLDASRDFQVTIFPKGQPPPIFSAGETRPQEDTTLGVDIRPDMFGGIEGPIYRQEIAAGDRGLQSSYIFKINGRIRYRLEEGVLSGFLLQDRQDPSDGFEVLEIIDRIKTME